jgi:hypothetical protein
MDSMRRSSAVLLMIVKHAMADLNGCEGKEEE